jgi:hypothetical protein
VLLPGRCVAGVVVNMVVWAYIPSSQAGYCDAVARCGRSFLLTRTLTFESKMVNLEGSFFFSQGCRHGSIFF